MLWKIVNVKNCFQPVLSFVIFVLYTYKNVMTLRNTVIIFLIKLKINRCLKATCLAFE